jgi:hypothetical protein
MKVICRTCHRSFDGAERSMVCPHDRRLSVEQQDQHLLARHLLGKRVRFAHHVDDRQGAEVLSVTAEGLIAITGYTGHFAPHLFVVVEDPERAVS